MLTSRKEHNSMEFTQAVQTMGALSGLIMILMGSAWLKQYLKAMI